MTNVNVTVTNIVPLGGASTGGLKLGFINSAAKAAQNDTWTLGQATTIEYIHAMLDSTNVVDVTTTSTNVATLTGAGTGATSAIVVFR
jgi:hypothetical protein